MNWFEVSAMFLTYYIPLMALVKGIILPLSFMWDVLLKFASLLRYNDWFCMIAANPEILSATGYIAAHENLQKYETPGKSHLVLGMACRTLPATFYICDEKTNPFVFLYVGNMYFSYIFLYVIYICVHSTPTYFPCVHWYSF